MSKELREEYKKEKGLHPYWDNGEIRLEYASWLEQQNTELKATKDSLHDYCDNLENTIAELKAEAERFKDEQWVTYNWDNIESRPPTSGRYLIYRAKCDKMHFEQWNGSGWSSSNNDCTHWRQPLQPTKTDK